MRGTLALRKIGPVDEQPESRRAATERKRRYRAKLKAGGGTLLVPLENLNNTVSLLLDLGWLTLPDSENRTKIAAATGRLIDDLVRAEKIP